MNEMTREGAAINQMGITEEETLSWWWLFAVYGADIAIEKATGWTGNMYR
jgi:hypothetical protein